MKFFASWTNREPEFQKYDTQCNILVSPNNLPLIWSISHWEVLPKRLLVDSGAYSYRGNGIPTCEEVLKRQCYISNGWLNKNHLYFSHPDLIIPKKCSFKESNQIIESSIERAKSYFELHFKSKSASTPIGVIHGFNEETIVNSYYELKSIGYKHFALGSIGIRLSHSKDACMKAIETTVQYGIKPLHLYGITLPLNSNDFCYAIESFDTATPTKLSFYGTVLYGSPLKRYVISPNAKRKYRDRNFRFHDSLSAPLPCKCPVCKIDSNKLLQSSGNESKFYRIIHNYFQIKWETEKIT